MSLHAQTTQSPVPQPNPPTPVVDYADVIDPATEQRLNNILKNLSENPTANAEMGVVTVKTTNGQDIFDYSLAIMRGWGIGSSEKGGLLLVVAVDDRKYFTQVSRHLEGDLPDGLVGQIQRERLVPQFKQGNYNQGISDTVEAYVATLAAKRGFSVEGIDQRRAYRDRDVGTTSRGSRPTLGISKNMIIIIIIVVVFLFLSSRGGGGRSGCGGGGCLNMLLLNSLFNSGRGGWGSSGWGGGGFGGGSGWGGGGGGSDWGGFSGGGGDAGGGGAGGSW
ncbi:MAG TPA: TPM domain-containing protein [Pyrinomonadaceae bacterium]|nr:TPM domain-containing protein [Pyrinomonadaceae bacterium]